MSSEQPIPRSPADLRDELFTKTDAIMKPEATIVRSDIAAHETARDIAMHVVRQKRAHDAALAAAGKHVSSELVLQGYPPAVRQEQQASRVRVPRKVIGAIAALAVAGVGMGVVLHQRNEAPVGAESSAPRGVAEAIMGNIVDVEAAGMDALGPQSCNEPGAEIATVVLESVRVPLIYELEPSKKQKGAADWTFAVNKDNTSEGYMGKYTESHYPEVELHNVVVGITACEKEGTPELAVTQEGDRIEVNAADIDFKAKLSYEGVWPAGTTVTDESVVLYPGETELKENAGYTDQSVQKANEIHGVLKGDEIPDQAYGAINEAVKTVFDDMVSDEAENVRLPDGSGSFLEALRLAIKTRVSGGEITPAQVDVSGTITDVTPVLGDEELRGVVRDPSILPLDPPIEELVLADKVAVVIGAPAPEDTERS